MNSKELKKRKKRQKTRERQQRERAESYSILRGQREVARRTIVRNYLKTEMSDTNILSCLPGIDPQIIEDERSRLDK